MTKQERTLNRGELEKITITIMLSNDTDIDALAAKELPNRQLQSRTQKQLTLLLHYIEKFVK